MLRVVVDAVKLRDFPDRRALQVGRLTRGAQPKPLSVAVCPERYLWVRITGDVWMCLRDNTGHWYADEIEM